MREPYRDEKRTAATAISAGISTQPAHTQTRLLGELWKNPGYVDSSQQRRLGEVQTTARIIRPVGWPDYLSGLSNCQVEFCAEGKTHTILHLKMTIPARALTSAPAWGAFVEESVDALLCIFGKRIEAHDLFGVSVSARFI